MVSRLGVASAVVSVALVALFLVPPRYFVPGTFAVTSTMIAASVWVRGAPQLKIPTARSLSVGAVSAGALYAVFYGGNAAISYAKIPGLGAASESTIYSLVSNPSNPIAVQILLLLFDALGYELFFRGTLQKSLQPRLGLVSAPAVALADAALHVATLNPLWMATTFVADFAWGLTYYYGKGVGSSATSHFLWDLAIFVLRPIA